MIKRAKSKCTQNWHLYYIPLSQQQKKKIQSLTYIEIKINFCTPSKAPPIIWPHCEHTDKTTHKISEKFMYGFVLHYFNSSLLTFDIENSNLAILTFSQYWAQFQKAELTPYNTRCAFFYSPLGQGAMSTNLLTVITSRLELGYLPTSTTTGKGYKAKQSPFYMSLKQENFVMIPIFLSDS